MLKQVVLARSQGVKLRREDVRLDGRARAALDRTPPRGGLLLWIVKEQQIKRATSVQGLSPPPSYQEETGSSLRSTLLNPLSTLTFRMQ